ncbi:hypothetical protein GXW71_10055 [Roseomonas hellenica]|uniref:SRP54-type proteins GTP-binding domain-containing protein n=1 Tax=Plastoroseomonas hellenica TaxID=2687306 RepID=A0ABS5EWM0_9PROT|nr:FAD-binding oxidoreductase [Plastoroseomonas hellenica]MBR0664694.1 hypothetical protein [Plastoroseomonas hellenica]
MTRQGIAIEQAGERRPVLLIAVGRQRVGKTTLLNAISQHYREAGADLRIWNADLLNRMHSLSNFHRDALEAPVGSFDDTKAWIEERIGDQIAHRYDAILDVGGGETALNRLAAEVSLVDALEAQGIRPVAIHLLGPELADLDYLNASAETGLFAPEATILVLNEGLVTSGRSASFAFARVQEHPVVKRAVLKGAEVTMMPALGCMAQVTDRGLAFAEMAEGAQATGHPRTSYFDQARVGRWWNKAMPEFFARLRPEWMPRIPVREAAE